MTIELQMLTASAILCALLFTTYGHAQSRHWGVRFAVGNRENPPPLPAWANRALRAHQNLLENLPHFTVFVLVAQAIGVSNAATEAGAILFFVARVVHALVYIAGLPWIRSIAFFAGLLGEILIVSQLF